MKNQTKFKIINNTNLKNNKMKKYKNKWVKGKVFKIKINSKIRNFNPDWMKIPKPNSRVNIKINSKIRNFSPDKMKILKINIRRAKIELF